MTHKEFNCPDINGYIPLAVGKALNNKVNYNGDDTGDNISIKNKNYCELTGLYWIWKNDKDSDIIGISHYRRYFTKQKFFRKERGFIDNNTIEKILKTYDIILPPREIYRETATEQYCLNSGFKKDLDLVREIIKNKYPDYLETYDRIFNQNLIHQFNMMVTNKKLYNDYCKWLFDILFELEKNIDLSKGYNDYQKRIYGFLSERLLNVWVYKNKLKIKTLRAINVDMSLKELVRLNLRRVKNELIYLLKRK